MREVYDLGEEVLIVATDRISAFDVVMANGIPDKGAILNQMSAFWFGRLGGVCPSHFLSIDDSLVEARVGSRRPELAGRCTLAKKAKPLAIECVARAYITGSLLKEYAKQGGKVHELDLPSGLIESSKLPEVIFTPATKAVEGHDENISFQQAADIVGKETAEKVRDWTLDLFGRAVAHAAERGIILADTKFEFGETDNGIILIDEALTPDSSRYWTAADYAPGHSQASFDKQFVRDYLESIKFDKQPPGPALPADIVARTRAKYVEAYERITDKKFVSSN